LSRCSRVGPGTVQKVQVGAVSPGEVQSGSVRLDKGAAAGSGIHSFAGRPGDPPAMALVELMQASKLIASKSSPEPTAT
jgi:hypothetical protein